VQSHRDRLTPAAGAWRRPARPTPRAGRVHAGRPEAGPAEPPRLAFRADVEGLRGVAILLVVLFHAGVPGLSGGFVGVDVFFVLSGFLITGLLASELARTGTVSLAAFYARRFRRLLPAAAVTLVGTLAVVALVEPPLQVASAAESARAAAAFASNLFFAAGSTDYFGAAVETNPLLHTWSLSVEEQFYFACPAFVLVAAGSGLHARRLAVALVVVAAASLALCWWYALADRPVAFYGTHTRAWEFAAGALVALAPRLATRIDAAPRRLPAALTVAPGWLGLALVGGAVVGFSGRTAFPGLAALVPVVGTALVLGASTAPRAAVARALAAAPLQWVGRHSYAWYLWHWPALVVGAGVLGPLTTGTRLALVAGALALAVVTRALVEEPCRRARALSGRPRAVVALGAAFTLALVGGASLLLRSATREAERPEQRAFTDAVRDLPRPNRDNCGPAMLDSVPRACAYGAPNGTPGGGATVVLFGDSHAAHWFPALEPTARARGWTLVVLTKSACPSVDVSLREPLLGRAFVECDGWRRAALDSIRRRGPALVVISNSSEVVRGAPWEASRASVAPAEWERGTARTLAALRAAGAAAVVIQDTPNAGENVPQCLRRAAWRGRDAAVCDFARDGAIHAAASDAARRAVAASPDARLVDLTAAICPSARCAARAGDVVGYRDAHHLTARASARLATALAAALDSTGLPPALDRRARVLGGGARR
jgi:peptidoglycan/LPS O-acetylase OafA/YrhL